MYMVVENDTVLNKIAVFYSLKIKVVYGLSDRQLQPGLKVLDGIGCNH